MTALKGNTHQQLPTHHHHLHHRRRRQQQKSSLLQLQNTTSNLSLSRILFILTLITYNTTTIQAQSTVDDNNNSNNNPENKFCGISYKEAYQFCHLPPHQSLPCSSDSDCPYKLTCWTLKETCTQPPTTSPTFTPSFAPITSRSTNPSDHYYCGLGFDNLFGCARHCPSGDQAECPNGQICFFNTPCDARVQTKKPTVSVTTLNNDNEDTAKKEEEEGNVVVRPEEEDGAATYEDGEGDRNFCGRTITEAMESCSRDKHCPSGLNDECPDGMFCWSALPDCNINTMPTAHPTISPKPTPSPTISPTTRSPSATDSPTLPPINPKDDHFFCGLSWGDASQRCHMRCSEFSNNCNYGEECFNNVPCASKNPPPDTAKEPTVSPSRAPFPTEPTVSPRPTDVPVVREETLEPTQSPLEKDDMRNYFFCGLSWMDASRRCYKRCTSGHHIECPGDEQCFAQADCKRGVITKKPTPHPTAAPYAGTRMPTVSPAPSMSPTESQPTSSPLPPPTRAPNNDPTESPTTPWPTFQPTFAPCQGDPCPNPEHCRSKTGYCGAGPAYCTKPSWDSSCGIPTDPPTSAAPTSPWPSVSPSLSMKPTKESPPTISPSASPSKAPMSLADFFSKTNGPTNSNAMEDTADEELHPDEQHFEVDDPRGTFFCGVDWNHAITKCPTRCPNGESTECPSGWSCYAFTPCTNVGNIKPPTLKPTWEPTRHPIFKPTFKPISSEQAKTTSPTDVEVAPTLKPTLKPTGDRCRANPCEEPDQCRSKLGFCGVGIIYCNSESSWEPECDASYGANGGPSQAPSTLFDSWLNKQPDVTASDGADSSTTSSKNPMDGINEEMTTTNEIGVVQEDEEDEKEKEEVTYVDFTDYMGEGGWDDSSSQETKGEAWWRVDLSSTSRVQTSFLAIILLLVVLWYGFELE